MLYLLKNRILLCIAGILLSGFNTILAQKATVELSIDTCWNKQMESVYLHLPQQTIVAGDNLFFKAYLFNIYQPKNNNLSSVLHFDIVSPKGKILKNWKSYVNGSIFSGKIQIPDSVASGIYLLRSYTAWMLNTGDNLIFEAPIFIINNRLGNLDKLNSISRNPILYDSLIVDSLTGLNKQNGVNILSEINGNILQVELNTDVPIRDYKLVAILNGKVLADRDLIDYSGKINIRLNERSSGVVYLLILNLANKVIAQDGIVYKSLQKKLLTVNGLDKAYQPNDNIQFQLILDSNEKIDLGSVSCSVNRIYGLSFINETPSLEEYVGVCSKTPNIFIPSDSINPDLKNQFNWLNSPWGCFIGKEKHEIKYTRESELALLCGRLSHKSNGKQLPGITLSLSVNDSVPFVKFANTTSEGMFYFWLNKTYNNHNLFLKIINDTIGYNNVNWEIHNSEAPLENYRELTVNTNLHDKKIIKEISQLFLVNSFYFSDIANEKSHLASTPFIQYAPDFIVFPSEYTGLDNFMDVVNNIIPLVNLKKNGDNMELAVRNPDTKAINNSPLVLLNGIPFSNLNELANIPASEIEKVTVYNSLMYYGNYTLPGVVIIQTKAGGSGADKANERANVLENSVLEAQESIYNIENASSKEKPNFSALVYWNPEMEFNEKSQADISFIASELTGTYKIKIEGFTSTGKPISVIRYFTIE